MSDEVAPQPEQNAHRGSERLHASESAARWLIAAAIGASAWAFTPPPPAVAAPGIAPTAPASPAPAASPAASPQPGASAAPTSPAGAAPAAAAQKIRPAGIDLVSTVRDIQRVLVDWFIALEQGNLSLLDDTITPSFRVTADRLSLGLDRRNFLMSENLETLNLLQVEFRVDVNPPRIDPSGDSAQVDVRWDRRARFRTSGQEWILTSQKATFFLRRERDSGGATPRFRIANVQGDDFVRTNYTGVTLVDQGTIDGRPVNFAQGVLSGVLGAGNNQLVGFPGIVVGQRPLPPRPGPNPGPNPPTPIVRAPDLIPGGLQTQVIPRLVGASDVMLFLTVANVGTGPSGATKVNAVLDGRVTQSTPLGALAAGATQSPTIMFTNVAPGRHRIVVQVLAVPGESSTVNNTASIDFSF